MMDKKSQSASAQKKGQAALEFIMTYGWAILVVLVAIGALAYFGVLSPDKFLPSKCTLQAGLACLDHRVLAPNVGAGYANGRITAVIQNSLGFDLNTVVARAGPCGDSGAGVNLANGAKATFNIDCIAANPISGSKFNGDLNISYTVTDTNLAHVNVGAITSRVE